MEKDKTNDVFFQEDDIIKYRINSLYVISDKHKLVYIQIPKAASTAIKNYMFSVDPNIRRSNTLTSEEYNCFFKFTFVRNPFDRIVSCYHDHILRKKSNVREQLNINLTTTFDQFCSAVYNFYSSHGSELLDPHLKPIYDLIKTKAFTKNNQYLELKYNCLDYIGRFEYINEDINKIIAFVNSDTENDFKRTSSPRTKNYKL